MKKTILSLFLILAIALGYAYSDIDRPSTDDASEENIAQQSSAVAFDKMMQVITHKRCVNCHPAGDIPLQGEDSHLHRFDIERGSDNHGLAGYQCSTCHQDTNNNFSGVPGAPEWALAPLEMAWEGKTRIEIATQMMDPARNGNRNPKEILKHLTEHELVLWAWEPGVDAEGIPREKPPVSKEEYISAVTEWINAGAIIPEQ